MKLLFVYNANKDFVSAIMGYGHKVLKPSTYECSLCELTYHNLGERKNWQRFRKSHSLDFVFMYKKEFKEKWSEKVELPAVFLAGENLKLLVSAESLNEMKTADQLIEAIDKSLSTTFQSKNSSL
jgi:adenine-specific DNA glycosylase